MWDSGGAPLLCPRSWRRTDRQIHGIYFLSFVRKRNTNNPPGEFEIIWELRLEIFAMITIQKEGPKTATFVCTACVSGTINFYEVLVLKYGFGTWHDIRVC